MELYYVSLRYEGAYDALAKRLHIDEDYEDEFRAVYDECVKVAAPKGVFKLSACRQENGVTQVDGERFDSRVLAVNLNGLSRVFPYAITCGRELYDLSRAASDPLERYWIDAFSEAALRAVGARLRETLAGQFGLGPISAVNPGSLADFPLPCQRPLFNILGEGPEKIGLELTPSFLMLPHKSGSGIFFESERHYENCSLCPRLDCPNRRAPYSEAMLRDYGLPAGAAPQDAGLPEAPRNQSKGQ